MKNKPTTIKDIAKRLNISPSTVSRALKNHPDISKKTKDLVSQVAAELDYEPNLIARSLLKRRTQNIGVLIPKIVHHFFSTVISGIEDVMHQHGYQVIITQSNESYTREVSSVQAFVASKVDGVFASLSKETTRFEHFYTLIKRETPILFFDRICPELDTHRVVVKDRAGAFLAVEHLIKTGCRNIVHLAGPNTLMISQDRLSGYLDAHRHYNLLIQPDLIIESDHQISAYQTVKELLASRRNIEGIFAVNDETAIGAIMAIKELGWNIPEDIAVIGFGDEPIAKIVEPNLSSVHQPGYEMGKITAQLFLKQIVQMESGTVVPETEVLDVQLMLRDTTK